MLIDVEDESVGQQRLQEIHGWPAAMWIKTSYNTRGGKHYDADGSESADQSKALRGNYAGIGYTWDEDNNIFWSKQPHASWTKNTSTASWVAPITYPSVIDDGQDPVVFTYLLIGMKLVIKLTTLKVGKLLNQMMQLIAELFMTGMVLLG